MRSPLVRVLFAALIVFGLTACGKSESEPEPVAATPLPDNTLSIVFTEDGNVQVPPQEVFTDKPVTLLRLELSSPTSGVAGCKMHKKIVTVVSTSRSDKVSDMHLGSVEMLREGRTCAGAMVVQLPLGSYGLMVDGVLSGEVIIKVSPKTPSAPTPTSTR